MNGRTRMKRSLPKLWRLQTARLGGSARLVAMSGTHLSLHVQATVNARVKGTVCPVCAEREVLAGYNDLATTDKQLLIEWNYELNKLKPTEVSRNSAKRAWWQCRYGHS